MRLMRNTSPDGQCKYAAVRMDKLRTMQEQGMAPQQWDAIKNALLTLSEAGLLENPKPGDPEEFLLLKLKDRFTPYGLNEYARAIWGHDEELARDVYELSRRSGESSPWCKNPD